MLPLFQAELPASLLQFQRYRSNFHSYLQIIEIVIFLTSAESGAFYIVSIFIKLNENV